MKEKLTNFYNSIKDPTLGSIFVGYMCFLTINPMKRDAGWGYCVLLVLFSYISAKYFDKNLIRIRKYTSSKTAIVFLFLLFIYFNFSLYGMVYLENDGLDGYQFESGWYIPVALIWTVPLFLQIAVSLFSWFSSPSEGQRTLSKEIKLKAVLLLAANYAIWIFAFNPCISTYDSAILFYQAHHMGEISMTNAHPAFYPIVLSFLLKICDSVTFLTALQCIAFSVLLVQILDFMYQRGVSKNYLLLMYLFCGFIFSNVIQLITLWKDIPFMISMLWLTFVLVKMVLEESKISFACHAELFISLVFTALFRNNGIFPAFAAVFFVLIFSLFRKRFTTVIPLLMFVASYFLITGPVFDYYQVIEKPSFKYSALANDMLGVYHVSPDTAEDMEAMEIINRITNGDPDNYYFLDDYANPCYSTTDTETEAPLDRYSIKEFMTIYFNLFKKHPKAMIRQILRRSSVIWNIIRRNEETTLDVNLHDDFHQNKLWDIYPHRVPNILTSILSAVSNFLTRNKLLYVFTWRSGVYLLMILFQFVFLLLKRRKWSLLPFIPVLVNTAALWVGSGWTDYRYFWPTVMICFLLIPYTMIMANEKYDATGSSRNTD